MHAPTAPLAEAADRYVELIWAKYGPGTNANIDGPRLAAVLTEWDAIGWRAEWGLLAEELGLSAPTSAVQVLVWARLRDHRTERAVA